MFCTLWSCSSASVPRPPSTISSVPSLLLSPTLLSLPFSPFPLHKNQQTARREEEKSAAQTSQRNLQGSVLSNPAGNFEGIGAADDMLELEHVIGFTGHYWETMQAHPTEGNVYFKAMGSVVAICDVLDPHNQKFLRAHDMEISAMSVSPSGSMLGEGERGAKRQQPHCTTFLHN